MKKLKPCPFCGTKVEMTKMPLWIGGHGYQDCYKFVVTCTKCGCTLKYMFSDTIYRNEEDAINNVIDAWNTRKNIKIAGIPQQKTGYWKAVYQGDEIIDYRCSECEFGNTFGKGTYGMNYCPNCGAKMEVDK